MAGIHAVKEMVAVTAVRRRVSGQYIIRLCRSTRAVCLLSLIGLYGFLNPHMKGNIIRMIRFESIADDTRDEDEIPVIFRTFLIAVHLPIAEIGIHIILYTVQCLYRIRKIKFVSFHESILQAVRSIEIIDGGTRCTHGNVSRRVGQLAHYHVGEHSMKHFNLFFGKSVLGNSSEFFVILLAVYEAIVATKLPITFVTRTFHFLQTC